MHLDQSDSLIQKTKALSPRIIFLSLGSADVNAANGDIAQFTELSGEFLETLQAEIPDAHIFVNSIFPVQEKAYKDYPAFEQMGSIMPPWNSCATVRGWGILIIPVL